jgi:hypothetical protein
MTTTNWNYKQSQRDHVMNGISPQCDDSVDVSWSHSNDRITVELTHHDLRKLDPKIAQVPNNHFISIIMDNGLCRLSAEISDWDLLFYILNG